MPDLLPDWHATVAATERALRARWDAWCPDDGRPAAALHAAATYMADPTALPEPAFQQTRQGAMRATMMAHDAADATTDAAERAADAALIVVALGTAAWSHHLADRPALMLPAADLLAQARTWLARLEDA
jgi:hypothetical protein